jgi:hypothetical protein
MKSRVKGRKRAAIVRLAEIALAAQIPQGFIYNLFESKLTEKHQ